MYEGKGIYLQMFYWLYCLKYEIAACEKKSMIILPCWVCGL